MVRRAVRRACFALLGSIGVSQRIGRVAWTAPLFWIWFLFLYLLLFLFIGVIFLKSEATLHLVDEAPLKR